MKPVSANATLVSDALAHYRRDVLRWNTQFNLITRHDPERKLEALVRQSALGLELFWTEVMASRYEEGDRLWYLDLGSGGGLPGFVWHTMLSAGGLEPETWLVEPREKRAWFLARLPQICEVSTFGVLSGRWGEVALDGSMDPDVILISLKALHLNDREVLSGLTTAAEPKTARIVIARYYPPGQELDDDLTATLEIAPAGSTLPVGSLTLHPGARGALGVVDGRSARASIVFSTYDPS